jgi:hypothetical protein
MPLFAPVTMATLLRSMGGYTASAVRHPIQSASNLERHRCSVAATGRCNLTRNSTEMRRGNQVCRCRMCATAAVHVAVYCAAHQATVVMILLSMSRRTPSLMAIGHGILPRSRDSCCCWRE